MPKPDEARLPEFTDAAQPALKQRLFSPAPVHPELEIFAKLAAELVRGSTLVNPAAQGTWCRGLS